MNDHFARLRGLLTGLPSQHDGTALHKLFSTWPNDDSWDIALQYTAQHITSFETIQPEPTPTKQQLGPDGRYLLLAVLPHQSLSWSALQEITIDYLAWDQQTQQHRIVRIYPSLHNDIAARAEIGEQTRHTQTLHHPHILPIHDTNFTDAPCYVVMEQVFGPNLRQIMPKLRRACPPEEQHLVPLAITIQLLDAVQAAHDHTDLYGFSEPLIHMRILPENVVLSLDGDSYLTNFGIEPSLAGLFSSFGNPVAPVGYYAPEQLTPETAPTPRIDIFNVGIMLYEMLAFQHPFQGKTELDTIRKLYEGQHLPLRHIASHWPEALAEIIERALAHNPEDRYPSAAAMKQELQDWYQQCTRLSCTQTIATFLQRTCLTEALLTRYTCLSTEASTSVLPFYWGPHKCTGTGTGGASRGQQLPSSLRQAPEVRSGRGQSIGVSDLLSGVWRILRKQP